VILTFDVGSLEGGARAWRPGAVAPALQMPRVMTNVRSVGPTLALLLSLLVLVPRVGLAAAEDASPGVVLTPASSELPGTSEPAPLRLSEDSQALRPQRSRTPRGLRILAETGAGLLTGTGLAVAGGLVGNELCRAGIIGSLNSGGWFPCLAELVIGGFVGAGLGSSLGVFWGGEVTGGNGKLYGPLLGLASGFLTGVLASVLFGVSNAWYAVALPFMLGGSILGYELTTREDPAPQAPSAPAVASSRPRLQPLLTVSPRGALLGLGGSF